jgi:hypothetical protein
MPIIDPGKAIRIKSDRADKPAPAPVRLHPGDTIEYGITHEVRLTDGTSFWMKMSSTTTVQPGELAGEAANRLVGFIHDETERRVVEAIHSAQRI